MTVIVHLPKNMLLFQQQLATAHAEIVQRYVERLPCPHEQKLQIMQAVADKAKEVKNTT